jgi:hypothetical protein
MTGRVTRRVRQRRVFYVPGYDPFPPRRYREFYRKEGAAQARLQRYDLEMQAEAPGSGDYGWRVETRIDGHETVARLKVLVWSDLVQQSMRRGVAATYLLMLRTLWIFLSTGALWAMIRLRPGPMLAGAWPVAMLTGQLLVAMALGAAVWWGCAWLVPGWAGLAAGAVLGAGVVVAVLRWARRLDTKFFAYYLLYDFAQVAAHRGDFAPELADRMAGFVDEIHAALSEDGIDEVLVVGHSSGAALAVALVAAVERRGLPGGAGARLALLTLGQAIPMQAFLPEARGLRADLRQLSASKDVTWVDVTAKGDGVCFWLTDPAGVCGVAPRQQTGPLVFSAAFSETLRPETWRKIRWQFFRLHIQYLAAFDRPRDYDYFQITAGPVLLADRYRGRKPSPSREARPFSPHRTTQ